MNCRSCGNFSKYSFLDLGHSPPSNAFLKKKKDIEKVYPLKIFFCDLIQPNFGPIAIKAKNGTTKGIITILKKGGPTEIFTLVSTSRKIG